MSDRKELDGKWKGGDEGGSGSSIEGETIIRVYYMKKESIFNKTETNLHRFLKIINFHWDPKL